MLSRALKLLRLYWGYSQTDLANRIGTTQSVISEVEKGKRSPSIDLLNKYSEGLGVRMSQIMFFAEEVDGQPVVGKGQLIVADAVLSLLDKMKPREPVQ